MYLLWISQTALHHDNIHMDVGHGFSQKLLLL
jgi:hypothetical protein